MLLPYILTGGAPSDDAAGIRESGNGIPDLIDEARYEVDFWLRLRDGSGYSHGLTNPNGNNELFQAGPTAMPRGPTPPTPPCWPRPIASPARRR